MKWYFVAIVIWLVVFAPCTSAFAAEIAMQEMTESYTIIVNEQMLDFADLPTAPYKEGDTMMVPLRRIGEALGYQVDWDLETKAATIEDRYIQKATLFTGSAVVVFQGKLQIIDMSREIENALPTVIHDGTMYVPLEFFEEFFNDIKREDRIVTITPSTSELCAIETEPPKSDVEPINSLLL